ncbi:MAG TPA: choice-of-anchor D domain-containing protein [Acidimicrobiales bacterium]|nr:choice-of-anchor D domain-containing protein [Acidimicrobiales bacterium]
MSKKLVGTRRAFVAVPLALSAVLTLAVNPAMASPKSSPTPAITSWKASPRQLGDAGGTVTFTGKFKYAQTCTLSVSPHLSGLGSSSACGNTYSRKVTIPRNNSGSPLDYTFAFSVTNNTGTRHAQNLVIGVGAAPPPISFTPTSVYFGSQGVSIVSNPVNVQVTNNSGSATQNLTNFSLVGADTSDFTFTEGNCDVALSPRQSCDLSVTFKPQSGGSRTATLDVFDASWGASGTSAPLGLAGTGEFATASVNTSDLTFGTPEGVFIATDYEPITVTNSGSVPLLITNIYVQGGDAADFSLEGDTCEGVPGGNIISVGDTCTFLVSFDPSDSGTRSSEVVIVDNVAGAATDVPLTGTGEWSTSTVSTNNYTFPGTTSIGDYTVEDVTITNTSTTVGLRFADYTWTGPNPQDFVYYPYTTVDGSYVYCSTPGLVLDPGQSCEFELVFQPGSAEAGLTATIELYDNTNNNDGTPGYEQIVLTGTSTA